MGHPPCPPRPLRLVIIGTGFAGTTLVRALKRWYGPPLDLTLLSDESYTTFNPMLPKAVGASVFPEPVVEPVREMMRPGPVRRFVMGEARSVDWAAHAAVPHADRRGGPGRQLLRAQPAPPPGRPRSAAAAQPVAEQPRLEARRRLPGNAAGRDQRAAEA